MTIDVIYLAANRLRFTEASFASVLQNTNWNLVRRLLVYDDRSTDGTREFLLEAIAEVPADVSFIEHELASPPAVMNRYLRGDGETADAFVKIDNDICVPAGYLDALVSVFDLDPDLELLGMEPGRAGRPPENWDGAYGWIDGSHIGGVGLMRTSAFHERPPIPQRGRLGFTEWQHRYDPVRGWIAPDLPVFALDMVPDEPWATLSALYIDKGWQRFWPPYDGRVSSYLWGDVLGTAEPA